MPDEPQTQPAPSVERIARGVFLGIMAALAIILLAWWAWREIQKPSLAEQTEMSIHCTNEMLLAGGYYSAECRRWARERE